VLRRGQIRRHGRTLSGSHNAGGWHCRRTWCRLPPKKDTAVSAVGACCVEGACAEKKTGSDCFDSAHTQPHHLLGLPDLTDIAKDDCTRQTRPPSIEMLIIVAIRTSQPPACRPHRAVDNCGIDCNEKTLVCTGHLSQRGSIFTAMVTTASTRPAALNHALLRRVYMPHPPHFARSRFARLRDFCAGKVATSSSSLWLP
jgi:hypothetical protein